MGDFSHETESRHRLAALVRERYPSPKVLARDIQCTTKCAENIWSSHWPSSKHLDRIIAQLGRDVWTACFEPQINKALAEQDKRIAELERKLATEKARRLSFESDQGSPAKAQGRAK